MGLYINHFSGLTCARSVCMCIYHIIEHNIIRYDIILYVYVYIFNMILYCMYVYIYIFNMILYCMYIYIFNMISYCMYIYIYAHSDPAAHIKYPCRPPV